MTFLQFKDADGLRAFSSLNMPNTFRFTIGSHNYYMPSILADFLSPAVAEMHLVDPTLNYFLISDVSDDNLYFESFMLLASGREIEITPENCVFMEIVGSKLMNEEIVKVASEFATNISPITTENAVSRLNQKNSLGIIPIIEIKFISENFWVIDPTNLFQIEVKDFQLILSHPELKILNEDWLFQLILRLNTEKGQSYRILLSYVSFQDLSIESIQNFFERSKNIQIDDFILRSVQEKLTSANKNDQQHSTHITANQSEINYVYQKSRNQQNSFNSDFFKEYHLNHGQQTFDYISSLFDNSQSSTPDSSIYNFNNKFNPFEPKPPKPFPDYFWRMNSKNKNEKEDEKNDETKRKRLIDDEMFPFLNYPVEIRHTDKSEQIPIHFTNTDNFAFSSSSSDDENNEKTGKSLLEKVADQVFNTSQKIFDNQTERKEEEDKEKNSQSEQTGFFSSLRNGFWNIFTPVDQKEPENIIPREEELKTFDPESIFQNQNEAERNRSSGWPTPPPSDRRRHIHNEQQHNDNNIEHGNRAAAIAIHDNDNDNNRIHVNVENNVNVNHHSDKKSDDDDLDGYAGFEKEQY
ncbi:hypothetical protein M9Y10_000479 [Tritrichomonas musculus]|uniref:Uncharacterized protein n=1 Tax=Tritrichomonas musculus TaxID=1915356 RepID=A0ABR2L4E5_9EUKA